MAYLGNVPAEAYSSIDKQVITGDGGASYTLDHSVANENEIEVFVNNVRQEPSVAYTVSGTALTMTGNVESSDDFYVVFQGKAIQTTSHPEGHDLKARDGTFSGDLAVDTDTLYVDSTNDRVGIGTSSPSKAFVISNDGAAGLEIDPFNRSAGTGTSLLSYNRSGSAYVRADYDASEHLMMVSGSEKARFTSNGLTFNGDTAAANALDDYEEGTFTIGLTTGLTLSISNTTAHYTKIGNLVYFSWYSGGITSSGTQSGNVKITGLPFTAAGGTLEYGLFNYQHGSFFSSHVRGGYIERNTTNAFFITHDTTNAAPTIATSGTRYIMVAGCYRTDA